MTQPAKDAQPISHRDDDHPSLGERMAMVVRLVAPTPGIRPTVNKDKYRFWLRVVTLSPYIQIKAVLRVVRPLHQTGIDANTRHHAVIPGEPAPGLHAGWHELSCVDIAKRALNRNRTLPAQFIHRWLGKWNPQKSLHTRVLLYAVVTGP